MDNGESSITQDIGVTRQMKSIDNSQVKLSDPTIPAPPALPALATEGATLADPEATRVIETKKRSINLRNLPRSVARRYPGIKVFITNVGIEAEQTVNNGLRVIRNRNERASKALIEETKTRLLKDKVGQSERMGNRFIGRFTSGRRKMDRDLKQANRKLEQSRKECLEYRRNLNKVLDRYNKMAPEYGLNPIPIITDQYSDDEVFAIIKQIESRAEEVRSFDAVTATEMLNFSGGFRAQIIVFNQAFDQRNGVYNRGNYLGTANSRSLKIENTKANQALADNNKKIEELDEVDKMLQARRVTVSNQSNSQGSTPNDFDFPAEEQVEVSPKVEAPPGRPIEPIPAVEVAPSVEPLTVMPDKNQIVELIRQGLSNEEILDAIRYNLTAEQIKRVSLIQQLLRESNSSTQGA